MNKTEFEDFLKKSGFTLTEHNQYIKVIKVTKRVDPPFCRKIEEKQFVLYVHLNEDQSPKELYIGDESLCKSVFFGSKFLVNSYEDVVWILNHSCFKDTDIIVTQI